MIKTRVYDLEERTYVFARECRKLVKSLPRLRQNVIDGDQLIRASSWVAGNYIEANESLSKRDFVHRVKISRKEVKVGVCLGFGD